jgi:hypothetical protein
MEPQNDPGTVTDAEAPPEAEDQPPIVRRGRSEDLGPRGQQDRGEAADSASPNRGSVRLPMSLFYIERGLHSSMEKGEKGTRKRTTYMCKKV